MKTIATVFLGGPYCGLQAEYEGRSTLNLMGGYYVLTMRHDKKERQVWQWCSGNQVRIASLKGGVK